MDAEKSLEHMLERLNGSERTLNKQIFAMGDIFEKSNNVLLQIEATRCSKPVYNIPKDAVHFTYNKDSLHALATIIESFQLVGTENASKMKDDPQLTSDFEMFLQNIGHKMETVGGSVRKLLAINDTVSQMRSNLDSAEESEIE